MEGTSDGTSKTRAKWPAVGDDVVGCGGGTGVTLLEVGKPFGGDVVLGGRPRTAGHHKLGTGVGWWVGRGLAEFADDEVRVVSSV